MQQYKIIRVHSRERYEMKWAIYRIHYGIDFLKQSIDSVLPFVDNVIVCYSNFNWVKADSVRYFNETVLINNPENVLQFLEDNYALNEKVSYWRQEFDTPKNQFRIILQEIVKRKECVPSYVLMMEPDMIFDVSDPFILFDEMKNRDLSNISTTQIELWKNSNWRIPQRDRVGPTLWNLNKSPNFTTHFGTTCSSNNINVSNKIQNYNFGFCMNEQTMLYKHLVTMAYSAKIGDSLPSEVWYRDKWLNWKPETKNLEIAENAKNSITNAIPYKMEDRFREQFDEQ